MVVSVGSKTFPSAEDVSSDEFNTQAIEKAKMNVVSSPRQNICLKCHHGQTLIAISACVIIALVVILAVKIPGQHNKRGPLLVLKPSAPPSFDMQFVSSLTELFLQVSLRVNTVR